MAKRMEFSRKVKRQIYERAAGKCEICRAILKVGEGDVDHVLSCALGGQPTLANGRLLCRACHKAKSAAEVKELRHGDRMRDKHTGVVRPSGKLKGAPFVKSPKSAGRQSKQMLPPRPLFQETRS